MLATDIDVCWTRDIAGGAIEVLRHDVVADPAAVRTSPACALLEDATVRQIRGRLAAGGLDLTTAPMISAWGRRPATAAAQA